MHLQYASIYSIPAKSVPNYIPDKIKKRDAIQTPRPLKTKYKMKTKTKTQQSISTNSPQHPFQGLAFQVYSRP